MAVATGGREARTHYTVVERFAEATLVECKLDTGRTHQIRVHLAAIGHPVAGDARYRGAKLFGLERPFLHAAALGFEHPATGKWESYASELPADLAAVREAARAAQ
jgi:23S rRNA pseudouridine1911/1915/1917 synthase